MDFCLLLLLLPHSPHIAPEVGGIWLRWLLRGVTCFSWGWRRATHLASQAEGLEAFPTWKSASPAHLVFLAIPASLPGHKRAQCSRGGLTGPCSLHKHPELGKVSACPTPLMDPAAAPHRAPTLSPSQPADLHCCFPSPGKPQELCQPRSEPLGRASAPVIKPPAKKPACRLTTATSFITQLHIISSFPFITWTEVQQKCMFLCWPRFSS